VKVYILEMIVRLLQKKIDKLVLVIIQGLNSMDFRCNRSVVATLASRHAIIQKVSCILNLVYFKDLTGL
jgi:hypothetical protein